MKQISTQFELIEIGNKGNNLKKTLNSAQVMASMKEIYVGDCANWKVKWKELINFDVSNCCIYFETDEKTFELVNADITTWSMFQTFVQKRWSKLHDIPPVKATVFDDPAPILRTAKTTRKKREYGSKASRHQSILQAAALNRNMAWSDDDDMAKPTALVKSSEESINTQSPTISLVAHDSEGETTTIAMSDDDAQSPITKTNRTTKRRPIKAKKRRLSKRTIDSDSDDSELFNEVTMTSPVSKNLVTPRNAFLDEDDDLNSNAEETSQLKVSDFFKAKSTAVFFEPKPKSEKTGALLPQPPIKFRSVLQTAQSHTPLRTDHKSWMERSPLKSIQSKLPPTRELSPSREPFFKIKSPVRSISRHFVPPKDLGVSDAIDDSDDANPDGAHKRLRLSTGGTRFVNRSSSFGRSKADAVLNSEAVTPRKIPFDSHSPLSSSKTQHLAGKGAPTAQMASPPSKWKGLRNLGNTCYLNSSLQLLCSVSDFCTRLIGLGSSVSNSLVAVSTELRESLSSSVTPRQLKDAIDAVTDRFSGNEQRDAHEFLSELIDRVHDEVEAMQSHGGENKENLPMNVVTTEKTVKTTPVLTDEFFRMNVQVCLKCDSCGYERTMNEMYRHLSIAVDRHPTKEGTEERPTWSVDDGLNRFFQAEQREVKCEKCDGGSTATQTLLVTSQPKALILQLKRFVAKEKPRIMRPIVRIPDSSEENKEPSGTEAVSPQVEIVISKNRDSVVLAETLDLGNYTSRERSFDKYRLTGIVHHHGNTPSSGHYTADAIREDGDESQWVSFDDGSVYPCNIAKVLKSPHSQSSAYLLLYALEPTIQTP